MNLGNVWERFLDSLDSSGGHIFVLIVLMLVGVGMIAGGMAKGEDILIGAFSALMLALKVAHSNYARKNGSTSTGETA